MSNRHSFYILLDRMDYQRMVENFLAVHLNDNSRYESINTFIQEVISSSKTFSSPDECVDFITDITNTNIFLIISHLTGELVVSILHKFEQVCAIYVMPTHQASWTDQYWKIDVDAITDVDSLCYRLKAARERMERDRTSISFLSDLSNDFIDPTFMYTQLLRDSLLEMQFGDEDMKKFADFCRKLYKGNSVTERHIELFEQEYSHRSPVWW